MTDQRPGWHAAHLWTRDVVAPSNPNSGQLLHVGLDTRTTSTLLPLELARSLRDWLSWWCRDHGDTPPPTDPDHVILEIQRQRLALRERSEEYVSEEFRCGLAWADRALSEIASAARRSQTPSSSDEQRDRP